MPPADREPRARRGGRPVGPRVWLSTPLTDCPSSGPSWLSPAEADRWRGLGEQRKPAFLTSRVLMRGLLTEMAGGSPGQWRLDGRGNPLAPACGLRTSISHHTGRVAVAACGNTDGLGIDLERPRPALEGGRIARRWFGADEQLLLAQSEPEQAAALFYRFWTLKEAWVKATGRGLAGNLQAIRAGIDPAGGWRLCADTQQQGWRAWSGRVGEDWLAVIWRSPHHATPQIVPVAVGSAGDSDPVTLQPGAPLATDRQLESDGRLKPGGPLQLVVEPRV